MLSSRGNGRYFARARGVDLTTFGAALRGVTGVGALEGIVLMTIERLAELPEFHRDILYHL